MKSWLVWSVLSVLLVAGAALAADPKSPPPLPYSPGASDARGGAYTRSGPGVVDKDGTYYAPTGRNGYINSKTGEVVPLRNK